ncbi:MAG: hypothetical protein CVU11_13680 [Bacteroidetes bacterium HGW-Bacteroidetes-6]|jgi:uncharacterized membrane protein YkoI|nr:MAG: hypothetical protein CVU11_13680 [Bacteroidetes bacterium HGW-Bacteroidetes-6]
MKKILIVLFVAMMAASCNTSKKASHNSTTGNATTVSEADRDGTSYEKAIVIQEKTESTGVDAEYAWLKEHYPGYKMKQQSLTNQNGKPYDLIEIVTAQGKEMTIYFDISNFFGKW